VLRLVEQFPRASYHWIVFSATGERGQEAAASARAFLGPVQQEVRTEGFRDGFFPYQGAEIKEYFECLKSEVNPQLIFTHYRDDRHQDHRLISDLTWNTFRDHLILEYEIPKYDGDLRTPNLYVHLSQALARQKVGYLQQYFFTQGGKHWFSGDTFLSLMRIRGIESKAAEGHAEAFHAHKFVV
jgi:LmbE family N-acetylglucosaminyl deacetylase